MVRQALMEQNTPLIQPVNNGEPGPFERRPRDHLQIVMWALQIGVSLAVRSEFYNL